MNHQQISTNIKLCALLALIALAIVTMSIFDASGKMSHDSAYYLRLVNNLLNGHGYFVSPSLDGDDGAFFAVWPVGYPTLIATISFLLGTPIYWSSKITNFLLVCFLFWFLKLAFRERAHVPAASFLSAPMLLMSASTLSELPFTVAVIAGTVACYKYLETEHKRWIIAIILLGIGSFLSRYIGLYFIIWLGLVFILHVFKKDTRQAMTIFATVVLISLFCLAYLYMNKAFSGHLTGQMRGPAVESHAELTTGLLTALIAETNLVTRHPGNSVPGQAIYYAGFFISILAILVGFIGSRAGVEAKKITHHINKMWFLFVSSGLLYIACLIALRWTYQFDMFNGRLLAPFTALLLFALVSFIHEERAGWRRFEVSWLSIMGLAVFLNAVAYPVQSVRSGNATLFDHFDMIKKNYGELRPGDVLISTNDFVQLVHPKLYWQRPHSETQFLRMVREGCLLENRRVFTDVGDYLEVLGEGVDYYYLDGYDYTYSRSEKKSLVELDCESAMSLSD